MIAVTAHSVLPGGGSAWVLCSCFGMLAAKSSILILDFGNPRSCSEVETACIMPSGPQMNAVSTSARSSQCESSASVFCRSIRPLRSAMS